MSPFDLSVLFFFVAVLIKAAHDFTAFWQEEDEIYSEMTQLRRRKIPIQAQRRAAVQQPRRKKARITPIRTPDRKRDKRAA